MSKTSNTGYTNISYDISRNRYRCEMRISGVSRTARLSTLQEALEVRKKWIEERDKSTINITSNDGLETKIRKTKPTIEIIHETCTVDFD